MATARMIFKDLAEQQPAGSEKAQLYEGLRKLASAVSDIEDKVKKLENDIKHVRSAV